MMQIIKARNLISKLFDTLVNQIGFLILPFGLRNEIEGKIISLNGSRYLKLAPNLGCLFVFFLGMYIRRRI
jgi:hypothetical protein